MPSCGREPWVPERCRRGHSARLLAGTRGSNPSYTIHRWEKVFLRFLSLLQSRPCLSPSPPWHRAMFLLNPGSLMEYAHCGQDVFRLKPRI